VAQAVEFLLCKGKALSSQPSSSKKKKRAEGMAQLAEGMAQLAECLPSKCEALISNSCAKKGERKVK
jgi:hypothetical protein